MRRGSRCLAGASASAQSIFEVAGDGAIGDETLTTDGGQAALPVNGGTWAAEGSSAGGGNTAESFLVSPAVEVPTAGNVTLKFDHRYFFESGWDGGAVFVSVNGAPATYLEGTAFSANGYAGDTTANPGTAWTGGEEVFYGKSADYDTPAFVESVADLGSLNAGDTISVEFRGIWDEDFNEAGTDWEISGVTLEDSLGSAFLDVDFVSDGSSNFTVVNNANVQNPFVYSKGISTFEINADTLAADRYTPDVAGSVIDLNDASIAVEVLSGTLEANDEFTLFDLSGGTTLTGNIGSLTLPPGLWDSSTLAVDGRLILLLPEDSFGATPGAGLFIDASQDTDPLDGRAPDFADGNPTGFDLMLDDDPAVTQVSVSSTNFPRIKSAYDMPGGATGNEAGAHPSDVGSTNQRSFQEAPGDWSNEDVTIEIWFKPDSLTPANAGNTNGQILFEDGGGTGFGFFVDDSGEMQLQKAPGSGIVAYDLIGDPSNLLLDPATAEFIQVVGTYDVTVGEMELFVNGTSVGTDTPTGNDWSGGDAAGIGTRGDNNVGGIGNGQQNTESLDGQVAVFRVYRDRILTPPEVQANFTELATPDTTPPSYVGLSPANLSTGVFFEDDLVATFTEEIALTGNGSVTFRNLDTSGDTVISLPDLRVSVSGNQLIIDPTTLAFDTNYAVLISADAIVDEASTPNAFAGITDETRWTFTTDPRDLDDPVITSLSPPDDGTGVQALDSLVVTFDETVLITGGDITLRNLTENTESTISLTDDMQVSLDDKEMTSRENSKKNIAASVRP